MNEISADLLRKAEALKDVLHRAPQAVGAIAVNHFKGNFVRQGFLDAANIPWMPRKSDKDRTRAILVKSARLKNSIRVVRADTNEVAVGTDVPYAKIHNEGGEIRQYARSETFKRNRGTRGKFSKGTNRQQEGFTFGDRTIVIPKRQFIGDSMALNNDIDSWYRTNIGNALK